MNKKRGLLLVLLVFGVLLVFAAQYVNAATITGNAIVSDSENAKENLEDIDKYESLSLSLSIDGSVMLSQAGQLNAILSLVPESDTRQSIISVEKTADPSADIKQEKNSITYLWNNVNSVGFGLKTDVNTHVVFPSNIKLPFPTEIKENLEYTRASEYIDLTPEIKEKANEIVAGKTDMLEALSALADFVNQNVIYDETYTDVVKKSSFVLENKRGVCDEFTNLFVAFCRSLGIPARYVAGVAYSNVKKEFGNHAWAEVYLPGQGWIPFDPTYAQYGWVDVTHVSMSKTINAATSVTYQYPSNAQIDAKKLSIKTKITAKGDKIEQKADMEIKLLKDIVKDGTYTPLEVKLRNNNNYYVPLIVYITKSPGVYGKNTKAVLLKPNQEKTIFFIITTPTDIEEGFRYVGTIEVKSSCNNLANTTIDFSKSYSQGFDLAMAFMIIEKLSVKEEEISYNVDVECAGTKSEFYEDEDVEAECIASNKGNILMKNLKLCVEEECRTFDLAIGDKKKELFELRKDNADYMVTLENDKVSKSSYLGVNLLKKPSVKILDINPKNLDYEKNNVTLVLESKSVCQNVEIKMNSLLMKKQDIGLKEDLKINLPGKNALGEKIKVKVSCEDFHGRLYEDSKTFEVKVNNVPVYAKFLQFFYKLLGL